MTAGSAGVAETHSAVVFFFGEHAYKVKKPVDLGFLDFRTLEARRVVCHREVELNRRLAPDVYIGVADVLDAGGATCEHMVVMRRMPADRRLATLVASGVDVDDELWHLAHLLAAFHSRAVRHAGADEAASLDATARRWAVNAAEMRALAGSVLADDAIGSVQCRAERYLAGRRPLFELRVGQGRVCDGHGDLLADDIFCLADGPRVLDCIEFDDRLRYGDVLADVAFLAMDLERLGRPELGARFLAAYREHAADTWPASLAHHHVAYRFQVRAKVTAIRAGQGDERSGPEAQRLLGLAHDHLLAGRVRLVVIGGLPGTGKSTLAAAVGEARDVTVLRSDEIRKELAGLPRDHPAPAPFGAGIYRLELTEQTYATMLQRAEVALGLGDSVVLDASWSDESWRQSARAVAANGHADIVELRCVTSPAIAAARMRARAAAGGDPSDATPDIAAAMAQRASPWPTSHAVDTTSADAAATVAVAEFDQSA